MYQKVLVPLDGSPLGECTLSHVIDLCKDGAIGAVTLLNIVKVDIPYERINFEYPKAFDLDAIREPILAESKQYLEKTASRLVAEGIAVETVSLEGHRPADIIVEHAKDMDLIIIGTHGYTGLKKLMMGSVAFAVLHQAHVPVLLIRPESCRL